MGMEGMPRKKQEGKDAPKHLSPEDIKNLDPKIQFAVNSEGQAIDVSNAEIEDRKKPAWQRKLESASGKKLETKKPPME